MTLSSRRCRMAATLIAVSALGVAVLVPPLVAQTGPSVQIQPVETAESGPLVAEGPAPDLALLYTGGVVGYVEPCG